MAAIMIEHDESEHEYHSRTSRGDVRALVGQVVRDLVQHGADQVRADKAGAALVATLDALNADGEVGAGMVLQALRHAHRPSRGGLLPHLAVLNYAEAASLALHAQHEAFLALCAANRNPELPAHVRPLLSAALDASVNQIELFQKVFWATEAPEVADMEVVGNA